MTVEDFERELSDLGQNIIDVGRGHLLDILDPIISEMRRHAPVATGHLMSSISAQLGPDYSITLGMAYYGPFQNYGVSGTQDFLGVPVPTEVGPPPSNGVNYKFRKRRFGLPRQEFFDLDNMRTEIVEKLQERLEQLTQE